MHLKATTNTSEPSNTTAAESRQAEVDADSSNILPFVSGPAAEAVVVTGDFNESQDSGNILNWRNHAVGDILPNNGEAYHPITTLLSAGLRAPKPVSVQGDSDTIGFTSTHGPTTRFDYTLYANNSDISYQSGQVFDTAQLSAAGMLPAGFAATDSANASDHLSVLSVFQVTAAPEPSGLSVFMSGIAILSVLIRKKCAVLS